MPSTNSTQTVFIVGAGASKELNLPTGDELKKIIANKFKISADYGGNLHGGDRELLLAMSSKEANDRDYKNWQKYAKLTSEVMPLAPSIDNFLDAHSGNKVLEFCGKAAIVKSIIEAEKGSNVFVNVNGNIYNKINFNKCENTWLNAFFKTLSANCTITDLPKRLKTITFIIFNYDRCIEHFLYHAIIEYYDISREECASILSNLTIFHPYGSVGALPWRSRENAIEFGKELSVQELVTLANSIKTFTEGTSKSDSEINVMRSRLKSSDKIIFLGFAYHEINMNLLCPKVPLKDSRHQPKIFGTAFGQSPSDTENIIQTLSVLLNAPKDGVLIRNDKKSWELFYEYSRALSFESPRSRRIAP